MDVRPHYLQPEPCEFRKVVMTEEEMMIDRVVTWSIPITDDYGFHSWSTSCLKTSRTEVNTKEEDTSDALELYAEEEWPDLEEE